MKRSQWAVLVAVYAAAALVFWATPRFGSDSFVIQRAATPTGEPDATRSVTSLKDQSRPFDAAPALATDSLGKAASDAELTEQASIPAAAPAAETNVVDVARPDADPTEPTAALAAAPAAETPSVEIATP